MRAFITGCSGLSLTAAERSFLEEMRPVGLILFRRNCDSPTQIAALCAEFRAAVGWEEALILIDQEGGDVQRMRPPAWSLFPPAAFYGYLYAKDPALGLRMAWLGARLIAEELCACGITVNCAPVLDVVIPEAHSVIGKRAFGTDTSCITALGKAFAQGLEAGGVLPVLKHIPGHGHSRADSHKQLPIVTESESVLRAAYRPFQQLNAFPFAMTAHILYSCWDRDAPATLSSFIVREIIRKAIGFEGILMSDDLTMRALSGSLAERSAAAFSAGCDLVLYCGDALEEMKEVAETSPFLTGKTQQRLKKAVQRRASPADLDLEAARKEFFERIEVCALSSLS